MNRINHLIAGEKIYNSQGDMFQIICIATDVNRGTELVIYQGLFAPFQIFAMNKSNFSAEMNAERTGQAPENCDSKNLSIMLMILEAKSMKEKLEIFLDKKDSLSATDLGNIAVALDLVFASEEIEDQIDQIEQYLFTRARFETDRLR